MVVQILGAMIWNSAREIPLANGQHGCCNAATMLAEASRRKRRWPRWWRRVQVAARRANIFAVIEVVAVTAFLLMTAIAWRTLSNQTERGKLLPSELTATFTNEMIACGN